MTNYVVFICMLLSVGLRSQTSIENAIANILKDPVMSHASFGFMAFDLDSNKVLGKHNEMLSLSPASTTKLFSTISAIELLGPDFRPKTEIYYKGFITDSILHGDLIIRGGGDPSLGSSYLLGTGNEKKFLFDWVDSLKAKGIKTITGNIIADSKDFGSQGAPDGWSWADLGNYYGASPAGICVYDNAIRYYLTTNSKAGNKAQLIKQFPNIAGFKFNNSITGDHTSSDNTSFYGGPFENNRSGKGTIPVSQDNYMVKSSLPNPDLQLAHDFTATCKEQHILVSGTYLKREQSDSLIDYSSLNKLFIYQGKSIAEIIKITNLKSINLFAEQLVCLIGHEKRGQGLTEIGIEVIETHWKNKIDFKGLLLKDGSGLSRTNGISCENLIQILTYAKQQDYFPVFEASLPVAGRSGTLTSLCKGQPCEGVTHAKSGTMKRIKSYAGYIHTTTGRNICFAVISNNFNCKSSTMVTKIEPLLNALSGL